MEIITSKMFAGIVAGIISFSAHPLYIRAIIRKETTPHIFTWILEAILAGVALFFYSTAGGGTTIFMFIGDFIGFLIIAWLALIYGKKNKFYFSDWVCLFGALFSIAVFLVTRNAFWAFVMALSADVFALFPTIRKTFSQPSSEDFLAWSFTCAGNVAALFAMDWMNNIELVYIYTVLVIDGIVWLIIFNGNKIKRIFNFKIKGNNLRVGRLYQ